jgi:hypothetical protein
MYSDLNAGPCRFFAEQAMYRDAGLVALLVLLVAIRRIRWRLAIAIGLVWFVASAIASFYIFDCAT